jgi:hypothetical protein
MEGVFTPWSRKLLSLSAGQEIARLLWNWKVQYRIQKK